MSPRRGNIDNRCPKCSINHELCYCDQISKRSSKTRVSVIFHIKERALTSNTGKIALQCLNNSKELIRGLKDQPIDEDFTVNESYTPLYLYPSDDAVDLDSDFLSSLDKPVNLIVPDATWRQTKRFHKRERALDGIQHVKIPFSKSSIYQLRKQKYEDGLCTIEAIACALEVIEDKEIANHLMNVLKVMNQRMMDTRTYRKNLMPLL